jgi:lipid A 3-O-deacylase
MPHRRRRRTLAALALAACAGAAAPAAALEPPAEWALSAGVANLVDDERSGMGGVEARWGTLRLPLADRHLPFDPTLGLTADGNGSTYAYLSFRSDVAAAWAALAGRLAPPPLAERRWRLTAFTGLGHYRRGAEGRELGGPLEFRSGVELARRLGPRSWLGLSLDHKSNAGIYDSNRGTEDLALVWTWRP